MLSFLRGWKKKGNSLPYNDWSIYFVMWHISNFRVFSPASCDDEIKDILLLRHINMLHWLKPSDLDVALDMNNLNVQRVFEQAREGTLCCRQQLHYGLRYFIHLNYERNLTIFGIYHQPLIEVL